MDATTNICLQPAWKALPFPGPCAIDPDPWFATTIAERQGLLIAGGPERICVFRIGARQRLWFSMPARFRFSGYAVSEEGLYLQDGPVLGFWSLTESMSSGGQSMPICLAATNLVTRKSVTASDDPGSTAGQLDLVYQLGNRDAEKLQGIARARRRLAWATFSAKVETARSTLAHSDSLDLARREGVDRLSSDVLNMCATSDRAGDAGFTGWDNPQAVFEGNARAALARAEAEAASLSFAPPVVRAYQIDRPVQEMIFVLAGDGSLYSLDDALTHVDVSRYEAPSDLRLALAEFPAPNDPSNLRCRLYYVTERGAIRELDADSAPVSAGGIWPARGPPTDPLPLSFVDSLIFGGGVLGSDFLALPPKPPESAVISVARANGPWRHYEIDAGKKLALVSDGQSARLTAYGVGVRARDRWRVATAPGWAIFWPPPATTAGAPAPTFVLNVAKEADATGGNVDFRVFVANEVDAPDPELASTYPPDTPVLARGTFGPGSLPGALPRIGRMSARPVISKNTLYAVVQPAPTLDAIIAMCAPEARDGEPTVSPWDNYVAQIGRSAPDDVSAETAPLPVLQPDYLLAYNLSGLGSQALPAALAELTHLRAFAAGIEVSTSFNIEQGMSPPVTGFVTAARFSLIFADNGERCGVVSDQKGRFRIDSKYDGRPALVAGDARGDQDYLVFLDSSGRDTTSNFATWQSTPVTLDVNRLARMTITIRTYFSPPGGKQSRKPTVPV